MEIPFFPQKYNEKKYDITLSKYKEENQSKFVLRKYNEEKYHLPSENTKNKIQICPQKIQGKVKRFVLKNTVKAVPYFILRSQTTNTMYNGNTILPSGNTKNLNFFIATPNLLLFFLI